MHQPGMIPGIQRSCHCSLCWKPNDTSTSGKLPHHSRASSLRAECLSNIHGSSAVTPQSTTDCQLLRNGIISFIHLWDGSFFPSGCHGVAQAGLPRSSTANVGGWRGGLFLNAKSTVGCGVGSYWILRHNQVLTFGARDVKISALPICYVPGK